MCDGERQKTRTSRYGTERTKRISTMISYEQSMSAALVERDKRTHLKAGFEPLEGGVDTNG